MVRYCTNSPDLATRIEVWMHFNSIRTKFCRKCRQDKPLSAFYSFPSPNPGRRLSTQCKECMNVKRRGSDASKDQRRQWRQTHPKQEKEQQKRYRIENPERIRALRQQARALRNLAVGEHTADDLVQMYLDQGGLCAYCEVPLNGIYHVEHMVPFCRGGTNDWSNLAISCPTCNRRKHDKTTKEYIDILRRS